jgi:hypothetical protein
VRSIDALLVFAVKKNTTRSLPISNSIRRWFFFSYRKTFAVRANKVHKLQRRGYLLSQHIVTIHVFRSVWPRSINILLTEYCVYVSLKITTLRASFMSIFICLALLTDVCHLILIFKKFGRFWWRFFRLGSDPLAGSCNHGTKKRSFDTKLGK